jgi:predicted nucleotidyltransferase component of viral defense system
MLTRPQVQRYAIESGLRDIMIAEKEVVLTYMLQLLAERGLLDRLAFKGGTCIRKMIVGSQGRFSTDLDFTALTAHDHEDVILAMMDAFETPYHGLRFTIPDGSYYETQDGLSWGVNPTYGHDWNQAGLSEIKLQVSRRETPTIPADARAQCEQSYFKLLPFAPRAVTCLAVPEILAEKIRACYQRNKARDMYDLGMFATKPHNRTLVRRLAVLKLWQARDSFDPEQLLVKFSDSKAYDWEDLGQLVRRTHPVDPTRIVADCVRGYQFLTELSEDERQLAADRHQHEVGLWDRLREECCGL